jgi:glycosyltransferase involved in cell wall biosynthesis
VILSVFPELEKPGGIQRLGGHVALAQLLAARERGLQTRFLSLNDPAGERTLTIAGHSVPFEGFGGNRARLALALMRSARRARLLHVGHVFLAPLLLATKAINPRLVTHVHIFGIDVWNRRSALQRLAVRRSDWVVSISDHTLARLREVQSLEPRRSTVIFPPLDPGFLSAGIDEAQALAAVRGRRFFLTVSRLATTEKFKGIRTAIDAFARLADAHPDVDYVIAGGGNDLENLRGEVASRGMEGRIHLPGRVSDDALRWLYAQCDAFVLPSAKEGFGIVFLEAMAFTKPCIGGNTGGTPEIVLEDDTGFLVGWDDIDEIARAMERLASDDALRARLGAAGYKRLQKVFTFDTFASRMEELIEESLGPRL